MIELEKTYLAKYLPDGLTNCKSKEIIDVYFPKSSEHPTLRLRKNGDKFEMTKKSPVSGTDSSVQKEETIHLTEEEFNSLSKVEGKRLHKIRYYYPIAEGFAEFDVFLEDLEALVMVDVEFEKENEKEKFSMPEFCLADVTQEKFVAGGILCGKKYADIEKDLERFNYQKL